MCGCLEIGANNMYYSDYYEEEVIDGRLHYRTKPHAEWIPMEPET